MTVRLLSGSSRKRGHRAKCSVLCPLSRLLYLALMYLLVLLPQPAGRVLYFLHFSWIVSLSPH